MTPDDTRAFRSLLVAGGGMVGLSVALAFKRALPWAEVTVLDLPRDPAALADRIGATLPHVGRFHASIGIDERDLVRRGIAIHHLATRFDGWPGTDAWTHGFGEIGRPASGVSFHQIWLRAKAAGRAEALERYSAAVTLAEAGRFVHPSNDAGSPLSTYLYALALDPDAYRERLLELAAAVGISLVGGEIDSLERRDDGGLSSVVTRDERRLCADLFIDCAGPSAPLLSSVDDGFEDWSDWLPVEQVEVATIEPPLTPLARVEASQGQWTLTHGWRRAAIGGGGGGVTVRPGRRPGPWTANVLAIGDSAVALGPLHGTNLHLAQRATLRALELLPGRACNPIETAEYNRRTKLEVERVRDFLALHYLAGARGPLPDTLALTIGQFEARGRLAHFEEETFSNHSWVAALLAAGITPRAPAAIAGAVDLDAAVAGMERLAAQLRDLPHGLPPYPDYLARMAAPRG